MARSKGKCRGCGMATSRRQPGTRERLCKACAARWTRMGNPGRRPCPLCSGRTYHAKTCPLYSALQKGARSNPGRRRRRGRRVRADAYAGPSTWGPDTTPDVSRPRRRRRRRNSDDWLKYSDVGPKRGSQRLAHGWLGWPKGSRLGDLPGGQRRRRRKRKGTSLLRNPSERAIMRQAMKAAWRRIKRG